MKIKKVTANTMPEAMGIIRKELGPQAVILHSKTVHKGGILGFFRTKKLEVVAAIDADLEPVVKERGKANHVAEKVELIQSTPNLTEVEIERNPLKDDMDELKVLMKQFAAQTSRMHSRGIPLPDNLHTLKKRLLDQEVEDTLVDELFDKLLPLTLQKEYTTEETRSFAKQFLLSKLDSISFGDHEAKTHYASLIGPTGAGKTTTLAKLAASAVLQEQKEIAFLTTDTYRIAAIDQLKTYAQLLHVPVEVIYKESDKQEIAAQMEKYDQVFIDTAGRNYRDETFIRQLLPLLPDLLDVNAYITFAATGKQRDWEAMMDNFQQIEHYRFIFTKLDETETYGTMLNLVLRYEKGIAFTTNGQDVPDDIQIASKEQLIDLILGVGEDGGPSK